MRVPVYESDYLWVIGPGFLHQVPSLVPEVKFKEDEDLQ